MKPKKKKKEKPEPSSPRKKKKSKKAPLLKKSTSPPPPVIPFYDPCIEGVKETVVFVYRKENLTLQFFFFFFFFLVNTNIFNIRELISFRQTHHPVYMYSLCKQIIFYPYLDTRIIYLLVIYG